MAEYIKREAISQVLQGIANGLLVGETEAIKAKDMKSLLKIKAAKEILKTVDNDLCFIPTADVQPVSVIKELQEHIKQRILETAFNNGGIYGEVAEDLADRIDIWVDEFRRTENG